MDAPGNDGNASMAKQVKRPNPWRKMMMMMTMMMMMMMTECVYCAVRTEAITAIHTQLGLSIQAKISDDFLGAVQASKR